MKVRKCNFGKYHLENIKIHKYLPQIMVKAPTVSKIQKFQIFYLQRVGRGHGVQFSQLHGLMANVKIDKSLPHILAIALPISNI